MKRILNRTVLIKISNIIIMGIAASMMIFTLIAVNLNKVDNSLFGYKMFIVKSNSMIPKFQVNDLVITKKVDTEDLEVGDIITFYFKNGEVVTHQIVEETVIDDEQAFITKGTNVNQNDEEPVLSSNIIGQYSFSLPKVGYIINFLKTIYGYILLILIPLMTIIVLNSIKIYKALKKSKQDKKTLLELKEKELEEEKLTNKKILEELALLKEQLNTGNNG